MRIPLGLPFFFAIMRLQAQQTPQYSLYAWNPYQFNPAYAGMESTLAITGVYRQQWSGLEGAPVSQYCNAHLPVYAISSGAGVRVPDEVGWERTRGRMSHSAIILRYRQVVPGVLVGRSKSGLPTGTALDGARLRAPEGIYTTIPTLPRNACAAAAGQAICRPTSFADLGALFRAEKWSAGTCFSAGAESAPCPLTSVCNCSWRGYFAQVTGFGLHGRNSGLVPSILVKSDLVKTQTDISAVINWRESTFAGFSYRDSEIHRRMRLFYLEG
jgi:hypothetical protein